MGMHVKKLPSLQIMYCFNFDFMYLYLNRLDFVFSLHCLISDNLNIHRYCNPHFHSIITCILTDVNLHRKTAMPRQRSHFPGLLHLHRIVHPLLVLCLHPLLRVHLLIRLHPLLQGHLLIRLHRLLNMHPLYIIIIA